MLRTLLLQLSQSRALAAWWTRNRFARRMSRRFIAGETLEEACAAARACNRMGLSATLDHLGENVTQTEQARRAQQTYLRILDCIEQQRLQAHVSLKLTQLGLDLDMEFCARLLEPIVRRAEACGSFVRIDMESSAYTDRTLQLCKRMRALSPAVGAVIQSYLYRSERDVGELIALGCRIRLCKGAYKEPPQIAFPRKADVDANFIRLMQMLLSSNLYHAIATHDPRMIQATKEFARLRGLSPDRFEFQMLYGIRSDLQQQLVREGYRVRIYIPFGPDWFPYFMRRLAERPANLFFLLRNLFRR
ncbi:MAG: proline dehydrogenase family protein [Firmicutes bacterium]|nr:proline dehydrogenase family protein [Bacillota bacterium]